MLLLFPRVQRPGISAACPKCGAACGPGSMETLAGLLEQLGLPGNLAALAPGAVARLPYCSTCRIAWVSLGG